MDLSLQEETMSSLGELINKGKLSQVESILKNEKKIEKSQNYLLSLILTFYRDFLSQTSKTLGILLPNVWRHETVEGSKTRREVFKIVRIFLQTGLNPNTVNNVETPLMTAVNTYDEELLEILVEHGADPNLRDGQGEMNAFALAIILNEVSVVKLFLSNRARVNDICCQNMTPLQLSMNKSKEVSKLLLQHGANVQQILDVQLHDDVQVAKPPLFQAVQNDNVYLATILIENGEDVNQSFSANGSSPIHVAVEQSNEEMMLLLIQYGANLDKADRRGCTPLGLALHSPHGEKIAMILLTSGCSTRKGSLINMLHKTYPPTHIAAFLGYDFHLDVLKYLLESAQSSKSDLPVTSSSSTDCGKEGKRTVVPNEGVQVSHVSSSTEGDRDSKLSDGDEISEDATSQMFILESKDGFSMKNTSHDNLLLFYGEDVINFQASDRSTPLFMAVLGGNLEIARYLYSRGGNPYITGSHGNLVHAAVMSPRSQELLHFALNFDLNINMINDFGNTPLTLSGRNNNWKICQTLIEKGANLNIADVRFGETALSQSVYFGCEDNAEILICHGANPDIPDARQTTALYWAIFNARERTLLLLLESGVRLTKPDLVRYPRNIKVMRNPESRELLENFCSQPASLQMCCRWMLRRHLSQLVHGRSIMERIKRLSLPQRLREFVAIKLLDS